MAPANTPGDPIDLVIDTSALVAILLGESDAESLLRILDHAAYPAISAANRAELLIVMDARIGAVGTERARVLLSMQRIHTAPLDETLADAAAGAYRRYGKGRHPAGLNFGDCFAYALAVRYAVPLLFKGEDFSRTDVLLPSLG